MFGFLIVIKPIRESNAFFMTYSNAFDRSKDRPYTFK